MQILRKTFGPLLGFSLLVSSPVWVGAQSQTNNPDEAKAADINRKVEELQKKIDELQSELQELRNRQSHAVAAPAPVLATTDPAIATIGTAQPAAAVPASPLPTPQSPSPATPQQPEKTTLASLLGPTTFSGFVDGYYGYNFDHPQITTTGGTVPAGNGGDRFSSYRAFDAPYQAFTLNMIELIADKPPDASNSRLGYHVALGFGNAMKELPHYSTKGGMLYAFSLP